MDYLQELKAKISAIRVFTTVHSSEFHLINNDDRLFVEYWLEFIHELKKYKYHSV